MDEEIVLTVEETSEPVRQNRFKSKALWASIIGLIVTVFSVFNVWQKIGIDSEAFSAIVAAVGSVLSAFGIFNDPTNKEGF